MEYKIAVFQLNVMSITHLINSKEYISIANYAIVLTSIAFIVKWLTSSFNINLISPYSLNLFSKFYKTFNFNSLKNIRNYSFIE